MESNDLVTGVSAEQVVVTEANPEGAVSTGGDQAQDVTVEPAKSVEFTHQPPLMPKKFRRVQAQYNKMFQKMAAKNKKDKELFERQLFEIKRTIGAEELNLLKAISTIKVPEQKNEKGEVTQPAHEYLDKGILLREAKNVMILLRERRILSGERKRSTGSSSRRRTHKTKLAFITRRNKAIEDQANAINHAKESEVISESAQSEKS